MAVDRLYPIQVEPAGMFHRCPALRPAGWHGLAQPGRDSEAPWSSRLCFAALRKTVPPSRAKGGLAGALMMVAVLASCGCGGPSSDIAVSRSTDAAQALVYDDRPWATVLRESVKDGLVDYTYLAAHRDPLDEYLGTLARCGPQATPNLFATPQARACYYLNAYNAGIVAAVLKGGVAPTLHKLEYGSVEHYFRALVDGRYQPLAELRRRALDETGGDVRVLFALCDGAMGSPTLFDQPFRPEGLEESLRLLAQKAMDDRDMVSVDHEQQALTLATMLVNHRGEFLEYYKRQTGAGDGTMLNVMLYFASSVRRQWLNTAVGYSERIIPFDRRINQWTASGAS